jgi:hypothetical protein
MTGNRNEEINGGTRFSPGPAVYCRWGKMFYISDFRAFRAAS